MNNMYTDEQHERLYRSFIETARILEELAKLFGPDPKDWKIIKASAEDVGAIKENIALLMETYIVDPKDMN